MNRLRQRAAFDMQYFAILDNVEKMTYCILFLTVNLTASAVLGVKQIKQ